ncbi:MAG TPA: DUF92 domain-containing protein [Chloroflexota bacterium]|nr:DUF92 domain-containing protein [Chloroflexota bacterium]
MTDVVRWGGAAIAAAGVAGLARWRRSLTSDGAVAATAVGTVTLARGGPPAAAAILAFFVTSSALSHFKSATKGRRSVLAQAKGGERDAMQVLANGGVATAALLLGGPRAPGAFLGALATAGADTWATELGLLARSTPRLVTTLSLVTPGTSGGVTWQGTLASVVGAATVGAAWGIPSGRMRAAVRAAVTAGTLGALTDSVLGATLQAGYWCDACGEPTETRTHVRCGGEARRVRGLAWIDNDAVNALATLCGAALGALLFRTHR